MVGKNLEGKFKELMDKTTDFKMLKALSKNELTILNYAGKREIAKMIIEDLNTLSEYCLSIVKDKNAPLIEKNRIKKLYEILEKVKEHEGVGKGCDKDILRESLRFGNYYHFLFENVAQIMIFSQEKKDLDRTWGFLEGFIMALSAKAFHIDDNIKTLLNMTNNRIGMRNMPFPVMYLDVTIEFGDSVYTGILISKNANHDKIDPELKTLLYNEEQMDKIKEFKNSISVQLLGYDKSDWGNLRYATKIHADGTFDRIDKHTKNILTFICNFLDYLNDPDVETVNLKEANERHDRELKNYYESCKMDLEHIYITRINRPVKFYPQREMSEGRSSFHCRFWVRGHFRTLRHKRYGEHIGRKRWVEPFIKGHGVLINKDYKVSQKEAKPSNQN
jgi:hypothetical protein